jgi:4-hydroxybenzoate polyprenyltransferase
MNAVRSFLTFARMIKLSHSIFALPFALAAAVLASRSVPVTWGQVALIVVCMVAARSSAMGFNRLVDRAYDAKNPRTASRELVTGALSTPAAVGFTALSAVVFVVASWALGPLTLVLSPVALVVVWGYSLTKRFTAWCHVVLGLARALAPPAGGVAGNLAPTAVWIALTGAWGPVPALLSLAVATWVAGFDLIYACQDAEFDRGAGLWSVPARFGVGAALKISAGAHVVTVAALAALPAVAPLGAIYFVGLAAITAVLVYEHRLVSESDLSRVDKAFFDLNGYVSLAFFLTVLLA